MRRRVARVRRRAARGLAAARGRGVHGAGQQRARDRRPRRCRPPPRWRPCGRSPNATGSRRGSRRRWARRGTRRSPRRGGCSTSATRRERSCPCRWRTSRLPSARRRTVGGERRGDSPVADATAVEVGEHTRRAATVEVGAPTDAWWRLVLGGPPTPAQRHVLGGAGALDPRGRAGRGGRGAGGRGGGPPARVGAHRRPRRPAPRPRHRAAGRRRALGTRARRPLGRAAGGGAQHRGARALRPAGLDRAPPLPLPGAAPAADPAPGATPTAPPPPRRRRAAATATSS